MASRCFGFVASLMISSSIFLGQLPAMANSQQSITPLSTTNTSSTAEVLAQVVPNFGVVTPFLLRGAQPSRQGFEALRAAGVKTVVNFRDGKKDIAVEKELVESLGHPVGARALAGQVEHRRGQGWHAAGERL